MSTLFKVKPLIVMLSAISSQVLYANTAQETSENTPIQLEAVVVKVAKTTALEQAKIKLDQVSGATNFIEAQQLQSARLATSEDVFALQPGIYAKSSGNEGVKVSIRGSGINRAPGAHASGLYVLLDDIPFTGPGGTPYELLEPLWLNHVEVFRGSNGFEKGALALGGAINYVTQTGQDAESLKLHYEMGSDGYQKYALSTGQKIQDLDYYLSIMGSTYDGYQQHSTGDGRGIAANIGYQINPNIDTRFYLRYRETEHQSPGRLTKQQIQHDPHAANAYNLQYDAKRIQSGSTWFANKTRFLLENGATLNASFAYHDYPMDLQESPYRTDVQYADVTASLNYSQPYQWNNLNSIFEANLRSTTHRPHSGVTESLRFPINGYAEGTITRQYTYRGSDNVLQLNNALELKPDLWLSTGLAAMYTRRESEVYYPVTGGKRSEDEWQIAPRLALRYTFLPSLELYGNLSQSVEPAHPWSMIWGSNVYFPQGSGAASGRQRTPIHLDAQKAHSFEVGGRGENRFGRWDLSYYYAKVKNELLSVEISPMPNPIIAESNASDTLHQGIELGFNSQKIPLTAWADLSLSQAYTYSDFSYQNDAVFAQNELPGLPKHFYQAQLRLDFNRGFYTSLNTEYAAKMPVDYANSFYSDAYQTWGLSLGYQAPTQKWQAWLDLKNLTDQHYAATITPGYNDHGQDFARSTPGIGFSTYAGVSMNF